ncbi:MAG TPA: hypothetical protein DEG43_03540 [Acidimicrobiaceae bacterium]|jgi:Lon-like protease|nr:hypothetical protein [Acidimicrobiaceae bacterium]
MSELSQRHGNDSSVPTGTEAELGSVLVADDAGTIVATRPRRRVLRWMAGGVLFAAGVGFVTIPLPYYVYSPGQATATEPLITVSGHDSFDPEGHILFTTVTQSEATPFLLTRAWLDDFRDVRKREDVIPAGDEEKERKINQQLMDESKRTALVVAFDVLGHPLEVSGQGAFIDALSDDLPARNFVKQGDVIVSIDGQQVGTVEDVTNLLANRQAAEEVRVGLRSSTNDQAYEVTIPLGSNPQDTSRGYLGVALSTFREKVDLPFDIEFDSGEVLGPSAGLAWTLGLVDRLTPGDLSGGRIVAVTGTIDAAGDVGPIGGIAQKVLGAKSEGATIFLYPNETSAKDVSELRKAAGDSIELYPVGSIQDAIKVLAPQGLGEFTISEEK